MRWARRPAIWESGWAISTVMGCLISSSPISRMSSMRSRSRSDTDFPGPNCYGGSGAVPLARHGIRNGVGGLRPGWPDWPSSTGPFAEVVLIRGRRCRDCSRWHPYAQQSQLFLNDTHGRFVDVSTANPAVCGFRGVGRGLAFGDLDNDGAVDLVAICAGGPVRVFHNVAPRRGHWLAVRALLPKTRGGRDAIGAEVIVQAQGRRWWRLIQPSTSYLVSNDPRIFSGSAPSSTSIPFA